MTQAEFDTKLTISLAAVALYEEHPDKLTYKSVAKATEMEVAHIRTLFPNKQAMLRFFYSSIPKRSYSMIEAIPDYQDLTISETVSQYVYQSFDLLNEHREFVDATFAEHVTDCGSGASLLKNTSKTFDRMIERDGRIPFLNRMFLKPIVFDTMAWQYVQLLRFWMKDESEGTEKTLELVDKSTALFQEMVYSGILDKGVDLGKFVFAQFKGTSK
jgi:AcrR family transcriptional regulator